MARCYIQDMLKCSGRPVRINQDNGPSDHWFRRLIKRHPQLSERSPENMDRARTSMSNKTIIDKYFLFLEETLMKYGLKDKASQIYNCDETGWSGKEVSRSKVLGPKHGHVFKQRVTSINHITAMLCVSADGRFLPSMMIYQGSLPHRPFSEGIPDSRLFAYSESGFMDGDLFFEWFTRLFIPNCGHTRPVMLLMDNHDSHITKRTVEAARENEIVLVGLPGHTTHILQPLDVKIIGPLKRRITTMASTMGHASTHQTIGKAKFPSLLRYAVDQTTPASIQAAFAVTGICPFNPTAIDTSQLVPTTFGNNEPENINKEPTRTCEACGSFLVNPLVKKGLVPECMASVLMPPPMKPCTTKQESSS